MPKAKTPRTTSTPAATPTTSAPVITMPEPKPTIVERKSFPGTQMADLETQIRERAYQIYVERGRTPGSENEDWLRAEQEVLSRKSHQASA